MSQAAALNAKCRNHLLRRRAAMRAVFDQLDAHSLKMLKGQPEFEPLRWQMLAQHLNVSTYTLQHWIRTARVPKRAAANIARAFPRHPVNTTALADLSASF